LTTISSPHQGQKKLGKQEQWCALIFHGRADPLTVGKMPVTSSPMSPIAYTTIQK
jgi:hypothetical protein